ncbi:MAG TPA: O-antigen ligase family protein [Patescibacteria group bacterium]|nr:O-antigen ligase family protein [Patescibacteria group bacterium]
MFTAAAIIFFICFTLLAWQNFRYAIIFFIVLLPTYLIRLQIVGLPTTVLELAWFAVTLVWVVKYGKADRFRLKEFFIKHRVFLILLILLLVSSAVGVVNAGAHHAVFTRGAYLALGQWRAYFFEPVIFLLLLVARRGNDKKKGEIDGELISTALIFSTISIAVVGVLQKFLPAFYPPSLWNDVLNGRVTSFYTSPNAVGLYLAPIIPLVVFKLKECWDKGKKSLFILFLILLGLNLLTIFLSFSQGGWIALMVGAWVAVISLGYKKTAIVLAVLGLLVGGLFVPLREAILFKDKGSQNRLRLWEVTGEYLTRNPINFVFGTGIRRFHADIQKPIFEAKEMERIIYPHNIFLNFWTEIGFLGMVAMVGIISWGFYLAYRLRKENLIWGTTILVSLVVLLVHGLVDVPYFKNDLAFLFWSLGALLVVKR